MEQILIARDAGVRFYKRYEIFILPALRFILGFYVFFLIGQIGHSADMLSFLSADSMRVPYAMLMGLLFSILPISVGYFLMALNITVQFSASPEVAVLVGSVLLLILLFYSRLGGAERWLLLFMIIGFYFGVPYIVPIIAGLYFGVQSIVPITLGVFLWEFYPLAFELMGVERAVAETILDIPESFGQVFVYGAETFTANDQWIAIAFVFALVTLGVFAASKMDVDFCKEIAIILGVIINIVSFIFLRLMIGLEANIFVVVLLSILSGLIVLFIKMFDVILNYQRAERVEFEDDENYYFVKVVPKMMIARRQGNVKKIRGSRVAGAGYVQAYDDDYEEPTEREEAYEDQYEDTYEEDTSSRRERYQESARYEESEQYQEQSAYETNNYDYDYDDDEDDDDQDQRRR